MNTPTTPNASVAQLDRASGFEPVALSTDRLRNSHYRAGYRGAQAELAVHALACGHTEQALPHLAALMATTADGEQWTYWWSAYVAASQRVCEVAP